MIAGLTGVTGTRSLIQSRMTSRNKFAINLLVNAAGDILFLKRGAASSIGPGQWGFPAGHIETGESPEECSIRELHEEIDNQIDVRLVNNIGPVRDTLFGGRYVIYLFHYQWVSGRVTLNHEHTGYAWVSREDYHNYDVVDGIDEDIFHLRIWPEEFLNSDRLPDRPAK